MLRFFGGAKSGHPMADLRDVHRILDEVRTGHSVSALDQIAHWLESVRTEQEFRADYRAVVALMLDEAAQTSVRKLSREYLTAPRLSKQEESRIWTAVHGFWRNATLAFVGALEGYVIGAKGRDDLRGHLPLLTVRALRALAAQMKWLHMRYAPVAPQLWRMVAGSYSLAESRRYAKTGVAVYPGVPGEETPEQEFLRVLMLSASSPGSLMPLEIELCERLIRHVTSRFVLSAAPRGDTSYWIDLAASSPPSRHERPPMEVKSLRYFGAGDALAEIESLERAVRTSGVVPADINLGWAYPPEQVVHVLQHIAAYWSPAPLERKYRRHRVKSRLTVAWGFDGVLDALAPGTSLSFDSSPLESWIAENVSAGGMGALVPKVKGDWLRVGALVAMQPEGGENWLLGVVRRISRGRAGDALIGIQTISRQPMPVALRVQGGETVSLDTETGILLSRSISEAEVDVMLQPGVHVAGHSLVFERAGRRVVLLPASVEERGIDYERVRCRQLVVEQ